MERRRKGKRSDEVHGSCSVRQRGLLNWEGVWLGGYVHGVTKPAMSGLFLDCFGVLFPDSLEAGVIFPAGGSQKPAKHVFPEPLLLVLVEEKLYIPLSSRNICIPPPEWAMLQYMYLIDLMVPVIQFLG